MRRKWMRRAALAAVLTLALAAPAQAASWTTWAPGPDLFQKAWQWLAGLWSAPEGDRPSPDLFKAGGGIDPMGNPSPPPPSGASGG